MGRTRRRTDRQLLGKMSVLQPTSFFQQPEMLAVYAEVPGMRPFEVSVTRGERMVARVQGYICRESGWKGWFSRRAIVQGGPEWGEDVTENELEQLL